MEGASGILSIVKAILMVKNGIILPTAGFEKINPKIQSKEKMRVAETPIPWPHGEPRRAIVTNFGETMPPESRVDMGLLSGKQDSAVAILQSSWRKLHPDLLQMAQMV